MPGVLCRLGLWVNRVLSCSQSQADGSHSCSPRHPCFCQQCCVFSNKALMGKESWFFTFLPLSLPFEAWDLSHLRCGFSVCFSVNCLHPWVCSHALPDVLAARLHSCPAPTSPGLLLVRPSLCVHYLCVCSGDVYLSLRPTALCTFLRESLKLSPDAAVPGDPAGITSSKWRPGNRNVHV